MENIANTLCGLYPELSDVPVANELSTFFHGALYPMPLRNSWFSTAVKMISKLS